MNPSRGSGRKKGKDAGRHHRAIQNRALAENEEQVPTAETWAELAREAGYSVGLLAKLSSMSVRTLERVFRATFGTPPREWLRRLRIVRAAGLLRTGNNVNETAYLLGYQDHSHFSREFKSAYGVPPKKYKGLSARRRFPMLAHAATLLSRSATKKRFP